MKYLKYSLFNEQEKYTLYLNQNTLFLKMCVFYKCAAFKLRVSEKLVIVILSTFFYLHKRIFYLYLQIDSRWYGLFNTIYNTQGRVAPIVVGLVSYFGCKALVYTDLSQKFRSKQRIPIVDTLNLKYHLFSD